jgi:hypothetical protein
LGQIMRQKYAGEPWDPMGMSYKLRLQTETLPKR